MLASVAAIAAAGLGIGVAVAVSGPGGQQATAAGGSTGRTAAVAGAPRNAAYSYYRSMMGSFYGGSMMGGSSYRWMMGAAGYQWMLGGAGAPGWMRGGNLPGFMMGTATDPGKIMGRLWASAPGPRVSPAEAARLGSQVPAGAVVSRAKHTITFTGQRVQVAVLASPAMPREFFRVAGLADPTIVVPAGARVSIELINADDDMAHGLVVTANGAASSWMPMMTARPAFGGSALWFLGEPTPAGMHAGTLTFTASAPGTYQYLCPVPGHAREGMEGSFVVRSTR